MQLSNELTEELKGYKDIASLRHYSQTFADLPFLNHLIDTYPVLYQSPVVTHSKLVADKKALKDDHKLLIFAEVQTLEQALVKHDFVRLPNLMNFV